MVSPNNYICREHSGCMARIKSLEENVDKIWNKWDGMQKILIGIFSGIILNLLGWIIFLVTRTKL